MQAIFASESSYARLRRTGREHLSAIASSEGGSLLLQFAWIRLKTFERFLPAPVQRNIIAYARAFSPSSADLAGLLRVGSVARSRRFSRPQLFRRRLQPSAPPAPAGTVTAPVLNAAKVVSTGWRPVVAAEAADDAVQAEIAARATPLLKKLVSRQDALLALLGKDDADQDNVKRDIQTLIFDYDGFLRTFPNYAAGLRALRFAFRQSRDAARIDGDAPQSQPTRSGHSDREESARQLSG